MKRLTKFLTLISMAAFAACGGGYSPTSFEYASHSVRRFAQDDRVQVLSKIVGVGDSLTAGYQADGFLGQSNFKDPLFRSTFVRPTQENGFWALVVEQASSASLSSAIRNMYDPAISPLPLIAEPGLDNQIVPAGPSSFVPFGQFKGTDPCKYDRGFNQAGFGLRASARVRMAPNSKNIRNFGIPGLTLHEANTIHQPQTDTCSPLPGIPGLLSDVVNEESGTYWPVLRSFSNLPHLTEVGAAASVHPTLATVWLGANDVLKYMGSGGRFVGGDQTAGQAEGDLRTTISTLQHAGAKIVLANLPNVLETGYFQRISKPKDKAACKIGTYATCLLELASLQTFVPKIAQTYHLDTPSGCVPTSLTKPCGYLTLPAVTLIINYFNTYGQLPDLDCAHPAPQCKSVEGSGLGANYITPSFAAKVQGLNNAINQGIENAASATHVPLVDIHAIFQGLASGNQSNSYFALASSINPGVCCTLGYIHLVGSTPVTGGILSFDGIHPSNTGYALIAYVFIKTINAAYGTDIPEVDLKAAYDGTRCSNVQYCFPDPYAGH